MTAIGTVAGLWRHPVKSMGGEALRESAIGRLGLLGDRAYALVDVETGKVASAKHPKRWPGMLDCAARYVEEPEVGEEPPAVEITLSDGTVTRSDSDDVDEVLSQWVGREVRLARSAPEGATYDAWWPDDVADVTPEDQRGQVSAETVGMLTPGSFFDTSAIHLLTTATLRRLEELYPDGRFDVRRFRPNVLVEADGAEFVEDGWLGQVVAGNGGARIPILVPMPRCVMTTLPQGDLERDSGILRTAAQHNRREIPGYGRYACVGALAASTAEGRIEVGEELELTDLREGELELPEGIEAG